MLSAFFSVDGLTVAVLTDEDFLFLTVLAVVGTLVR